MLFYTHLVFSFLIGLLSVDVFGIKRQMLFIILVMFFSVLPDIDMVKSKIGKKFGVVSYVIRLVFGHRGLFHTAWFSIILFVLFLFILDLRVIGLGVLVGYLSHLFLDSLTVQGVRPLSPFIEFRIRGFIKVGSVLEQVLFVLVVLGVIWRLV